MLGNEYLRREDSEGYSYRNDVEEGKYNYLIKELKDIKKTAPSLSSVPTGTGLDELFYAIEFDERTGKTVKKPLGGLPRGGVFNLVGIADTGKSVFVEQFAVYHAGNGGKVLFVTVESPAEFLYMGFRQKAVALGMEFEDIENNIVILDASRSGEFRENIYTVIKTMEIAFEKKDCDLTIIDSVTGFYEHKEILARQVVRVLFNFLKRNGQTGIFISQKRSSQQAESAEAAGGLAVAHIVDGTIVFDKKLIETKFDQSIYGLPIGGVLRTIRIDGCRLTAHSQETWVMTIEENGLIQIKERLSDFTKNTSEKRRW